MLDLGGTFSSFINTLFGVLSDFFQQLFAFLENLLSGISINLG